MWKNLYDGFLQKLTSTWAEYLQRFTTCGRTVRDKFFSDIYSWAALWLILFSILSCAIYYYYLNAKFGKYYSRKSYFLTMLANSLLIAIATFISGRVILKSFICPTTTHLIWISIINFLYGAILFFLISIVIKWKSYMGKRTPF